MYLHVLEGSVFMQTDQLKDEHIDIQSIQDGLDTIFTVSTDGEFVELIIDADRNFKWEKVQKSRP